jgi:hypothetical protein
MADPTPDISPDNIPAAPRASKLAEALARIAELEAKLAPFLKAEEQEKAAAEDAAKNRGAGIAPKLIGTIQVFDQDEPQDVLMRARAIRRGQIPTDRAKRFRTESPVMVSSKSKLAERLGRSLGVGVEFNRDELGAEDIRDLVAGGGIVAIA